MGEPESPPWLAQLRQELAPTRREAAAVLTSMSSSCPEVVYHYTSPQGLQGILGARSIWASNALYLNDWSEVSYVDQIVSELAGSLVDRARSPLAKKLLVGLGRPDWRGPHFEQHYVACFSAAEDRLSQWRAYAVDGRGYAVGIRTSTKFQLRGVHAAQVDLVRVIYKRPEQIDIIRPFVERAVDALNLCPDVWETQHASTALFEGTLSVVDAVSALGIAIKNRAFDEEEEWRLVVTDPKDCPTGTYVRYRPGAFGLTPYVELEPEGDYLDVHEVMLGPRLYDPRAMASTAGILSHHGYETAMPHALGYVRIIHSGATYRGAGEG